jgi:hypothetical protein
LRTGAGGLGAGATGRSDLNVDGGDADLLAAGSHILGGQHGGVGGRFVAVGLDLHTAGDARDGLLAGQIRHVHEGVVEGGKDVGDALSGGSDPVAQIFGERTQRQARPP